MSVCDFSLENDHLGSFAEELSVGRLGSRGLGNWALDAGGTAGPGLGAPMGAAP